LCDRTCAGPHHWVLSCAMASAVNLGLSVLSMGQDTFHHRNELLWNEIDYFLQLRQVSVDILNNVREDLQDLYDKDERMLDTNLVVVSLMMGIGFGFVVEGTFPEDDHSQADVRTLYSIVTGLGLVCPFLALLCLLECRRRINMFMKMFNRHFYEKIRKFNEELLMKHITSAEMMTGRAEAGTFGLPRWNFVRLPRRDGAVNEEAEASRMEEAVQVNLKEELGVHEDYLNWWSTWAESLAICSRLILFIGLFFNIFNAALLLGLYFQSNYPDTPSVWILYSSIVCFGLAIATVGSTVYRWNLPDVHFRTALQGRPEHGLPSWALATLQTPRQDGTLPANGASLRVKIVAYVSICICIGLLLVVTYLILGA